VYGGVSVVAVDVGIEAVPIVVGITRLISTDTVLVHAVATALGRPWVDQRVPVVAIAPPFGAVHMAVPVAIVRIALRIHTIAILVDSVAADLVTVRIATGVMAPERAVGVRRSIGAVLVVCPAITVEVVASEPLVHHAIAIVVLAVALRLRRHPWVDVRIRVVTVLRREVAISIGVVHAHCIDPIAVFVDTRVTDLRGTWKSPRVGVVTVLRGGGAITIGVIATRIPAAAILVQPVLTVGRRGVQRGILERVRVARVSDLSRRSFAERHIVTIRVAQVFREPFATPVLETILKIIAVEIATSSHVKWGQHHSHRTASGGIKLKGTSPDGDPIVPGDVGVLLRRERDHIANELPAQEATWDEHHDHGRLRGVALEGDGVQVAGHETGLPLSLFLEPEHQPVGARNNPTAVNLDGNSGLLFGHCATNQGAQPEHRENIPAHT
jgi:hypothetical protein